MRRSQLIQIAILVVALITGYKFIESIIGVFIPIIFQLGDSLTGAIGFVGRCLVISTIYGVVFLLLIKYNRSIAEYIDRQGTGKAESEEKVPLAIQPNNLLFIVIVALGLVTLIEEAPVLILSIYNYFKNEIGRLGARDDLNDMKFKISAITFVVAMVFLLAAKPISAWLSKQLSSEKPLIETIDEVGQPNN